MITIKWHRCRARLLLLLMVFTALYSLLLLSVFMDSGLGLSASSSPTPPCMWLHTGMGIKDEQRNWDFLFSFFFFSLPCLYFMSVARPPSHWQEEKSPTPLWCGTEEWEITLSILAASEALWRHWIGTEATVNMSARARKWVRAAANDEKAGKRQCCSGLVM